MPSSPRLQASALVRRGQHSGRIIAPSPRALYDLGSISDHWMQNLEWPRKPHSMKPIASFWAPGQSQSPVTEDQVRQCEAEFGVTFPRALLQVLQVHNGGSVRGAYSLEILPLVTSKRAERIRPLTEFAAAGEYLDDEALESIAEEIGDPRLLLVLAFDGAYGFALNFNANGPQGEPTVHMIDLGGNFMFGESRQIAATFQEVVDKVLAAT